MKLFNRGRVMYIQKPRQKETFSPKTILSASLLFASVNTLAAPGILQDIPLSISTYVQPNILMLIDDSGSMSWEILKSAGATEHYPTFPNWGNIDITPTDSDRSELLESCALYNVMYYDDSKVYTPWIGEDEGGNVYTDIVVTQAWGEPYYKTWSLNFLTLIDGGLDVAGYMPFTDVDGDGEFDIGDCNDGGTTAQMYDNFVPFTSMTSEQQINFANWYSYYRKREFVVKRALSEVIDDNTTRMGLATLHNNNSVGNIIKNIDNISQPIDPVANQNKKDLLKNLFEVSSTGLTPLRQTLNEAGRYFEEGQSPSTDFFGFTPVHSTNETVSGDSPILKAENGGSCQQNFSILFSDGQWNGGNPTGIANEDGDSNTLWDGGNFADNFSGSLADVAMRYLENDLSPTLADSNPNSNTGRVKDIRQSDVFIDHQHMNTYTVAFGLSGTLDMDPSDPSFPGWPAPFTESTRVDDVRHAAWNGRGSYLDANDPETLIDSLNEAVDDIESRTGTATSVSFNSGSISDNTLVFQSVFNTDDWSGDVLAYQFDDDGIIDRTNSNGITAEDAVWSANEKLISLINNSGASARNVVTYNGLQGVPFTFPNDYAALLNDGVATADETISDKTIIDLLTNAPHDISTNDAAEIAANQTFGLNITNYLKGDDLNEVDSDGVGLFRNRNGSALGAIVFSSPQYLGVPDENYPNLIEGAGDEYFTFRDDNANRTPIVFAGGNDGMLHAFVAENDPALGGQEIFAYIPQLLVNDLHKLSEVDYIHKAYVDSSPVIADVFVDNSGTGTKQWRSYLVGGVRTGGQGVYVLDVTDPAALALANTTARNASNIVVDEFTDPRMGFSFSRPQIARLNNGRWAAIFGNGYNNTGDGKAHLFILYLDNGEHKRIEASESAVNYLSNDSCYDAASNCNGLSSPSLADLNSDSIVDRVYAGDLHGNLWAFDLTGDDDDKWDVAFKNGSTIEPLFTACATSNCTIENRQAITVKPTIKFHPSRYAGSTSPNMMVFFGTGQFVAQGDTQTTDVQSFYGVWDAGVNRKTGRAEWLTKANLQQQQIDNALNISSETVDFSISEEFGWYIDLSIQGSSAFTGARSIDTPLVLGDIVFFLVTVPEDSICSPGGDSYLVALDLLDGTESQFNIFEDVDGNPSSAPIQNLGVTVVGIGSIDDLLVTTDKFGDVVARTVNTKKYIPPGRKSWSIIR